MYLIFFLFLFTLPLVAADWPQWRGPNRDGHVPADDKIPATLPATPKIIWHFRIGDGLASPVVANGKVFYLDAQGGRETAHAIAESDAKEIWHADLDGTFEDPQSAPGPRCTPVVDGPFVFVQSCRGELRCLKVTDGSVIWRTSYVTNFGAIVTGEHGKSEGAARHVTTPVVWKDIIFVASHEFGLVGIKISRETNEWQATKTWTRRELAINISSPVLAGDYLCGLGPQKNLIFVDAKSGELKWSQTGCISGAPDASHAAFIVMGTNILTLADGGELILFKADPSAFKEISRVQICGKTWCNPAYSDGKLFLRDGHELSCVGLIE